MIQLGSLKTSQKSSRSMSHTTKRIFLGKKQRRQAIRRIRTQIVTLVMRHQQRALLKKLELVLEHLQLDVKVKWQQQLHPRAQIFSLLMLLQLLQQLQLDKQTSSVHLPRPTMASVTLLNQHLQTILHQTWVVNQPQM